MEFQICTQGQRKGPKQGLRLLQKVAEQLGSGKSPKESKRQSWPSERELTGNNRRNSLSEEQPSQGAQRKSLGKTAAKKIKRKEEEGDRLSRWGIEQVTQ